MAAAEARAVWQRAVNRCFVQEDAKRAPKLACCQSSSSTSKQVDSEPASAAEEGDHFGIFMPFNRKPSFTNMPAENRWWLQQQPTYRFPKDLAYEGLNELDLEAELLNASIGDLFPKSAEMQKDEVCRHVEGEKNPGFLLETSRDVHNACVAEDFEDSSSVVSGLCNSDAKELKQADMMESFEVVGINHAGMSVSKQTNELFDLDSPWIGDGNTGPWWRMSDCNELASFVAKKSLDRIENCDLPPPQKMSVRKHPYSCIGCLDHNGVYEKSSLRRVDPLGTSCETVQAKSYHEFDQTFTRSWSHDEDNHFPRGSENSWSHETPYKDIPETVEAAAGDPAKIQLLEALCHSQTRAREAEKAAKQALAEKEHILKLFFRQASQLFAYKQWFRLLQLETAYLRTKNDDEPITGVCPVLLPLGPSKGKRMRRCCQKASKGRQAKRRRQRNDVTKYAVVFAVGLGLVGAGLLLGWTVGWMIPLF